jgi:hypothetical protein
MNRSIIAGVLFLVVFGVGYLMMIMGKDTAAPAPRAAEFKLSEPDRDDAKPEAPEKATEKQKAEPKPPIAKGPLVLNRWPLPKGQKTPEKSQGISVLIDPNGPLVVTQSKSDAMAWDPTNGAVHKTARVAEATSIAHKTAANGRPASQIRDEKSGRMIVELIEKNPRDACVTPDGQRIIIVGYPGVYSAYDTVGVPSGARKHHEAEYVKNVELYDIETSLLIDHFCPRDFDLDDEIWAVAAAADGKSFFVVNKTHLIQFNFERAFGVAPLRPARR